MNYLAIDVGGTDTKFAVITEACEILEKDKVPTVIEPLEDVVQMLAGIYDRYRGTVAGVALSMPGFVDSKNGYMYTGGTLVCVNHVNITELLGEYCDVPITVENDAKCAGMAEVWKGALADCNDGIVMVCGTALGGAIIHNREVISGSNFAAGELSYVYANADKTGEWSEVAGMRYSINVLIKNAAQKKAIPAEELDGMRIFEMANAGDGEMIQVIREFARGLAVQINNLQFIMDPERFAIGGGISVQPLFIRLLQEEVKTLNETYPWEVPCAKVTACQFTSDANLVGAAYVHLKAKGIL